MISIPLEDRKHFGTIEAMQSARVEGRVFGDGEEALAEVAKTNGNWNWALVGPTPKALSLLGGGAGGVEEMRSVIAKYPHSFGLLRLTFGAGGRLQNLIIFIHASNSKRSGGRLMRGQLSNADSMEMAIRKISAWSAKVHIEDQRQCTVRSLVDKVRGLESKDAPISMETYHHRNCFPAQPIGQEVTMQDQLVLDSAMEQGTEGDPADREKSDEMTCTSVSVDLPFALPPMSKLVTPLPEPERSADFAASLQRRVAKAYHVGDLVEIWSDKHRSWFKDGEVTDTVGEQCCRDGIQLRAGSVKVLYSGGRRVKWLAPQYIQDSLRLSSRPKAPEVMFGRLEKECHACVDGDSFSNITFWRPMYVEVSKGYMQWWEERAQALKGCQSQGHVYLLDMQLFKQGRLFKLQAKSTNGAMFAFRAETDEELHRWAGALREHARHCGSVQELESMTSRTQSGRGGA